MNIKSLLGWAVVAFIAFYVFKHPTDAAHTAHGLLGGLQHAGNSLSAFVSGL